MDRSLRKNEDSQAELVARLQQEITGLEAEFEQVKKELRAFETDIHSHLHRQIARVRALSALYKEQKKAKKAKRLEQKKRGKNYKEPKQLEPRQEREEAEVVLQDDEQKELKRLYREAVVQVHPDKFSRTGEDTEIQRATSLTARLNEIYKRGDLDELINFYQSVISGSELAGRILPMENKVDSATRLAALERKKEAVRMKLDQVRNSYSNTVLQTYENPLYFIEELRVQLEEQIRKLEKRTRKG